jgi:hypothetical protein
MVSTALTTIQERYPVLAADCNVQELIAENMAGESLGINLLTKIKVPRGGSLSWMVPTLEGEQAVKELEGVILNISRTRAYWATSKVTNDPPACRSNDMITGIGNPGGECDSCPFNQYGSATKDGGGAGRGKGCKERKILFMLRPGAMLPEAVILPPTCLKAMQKYQLTLTSNSVPYCAVITKLALKESSSRDGFKYAEIVPTMSGRLDKDAIDRVRSLAASLRGVMESTASDHTGEESDDE